MTVAALVSSISYLENGVTLSFAIPFRFLSGAIAVSRVLADGTVETLDEGPDFSTSGGATDSGGELVLVATVAGARLRIRRATSRVQAANYTPGDAFPAASHENALDRAMMIDQEQDDRIDDTAARAFLVPDGETAGDLPAKAERAMRYLAFDAAGAPIAVDGGTPLGDYLSVVAAEAIEPGDFVSIYTVGGEARVRRALASDAAREAHGFSLQGGGIGVAVQIQFAGINIMQAPGAFQQHMFLSDVLPGKATNVAPTAEGSFVQLLGVGMPGVGVRFDRRDAVFL